MTTTVGHDDRPPAAGAPLGHPAGARSRRSMLALAAVESGRLLRHPAVLAGTALSAWLLWRWGRGTAPVLHHADIATQLSLAPLAGAALLAVNLAVLRPHRDGAVDLYGATRLSLVRRTLAHLLSVLPLVALGGVLVAADLVWLAGMPGSVGRPHLAEAATGPALIALGGCLGVALGRLWRSVAVAPLALVVLAIGSLTLTELHMGGHGQRSWVWLGATLRAVTIDPPPAELLGRPATSHLVYLVGIATVLGALAVWRSQAQARLGRRRGQAATATVLVMGLAATAGAAVLQTRPTSPALTARRLAALREPAAELACQRRGPAVYCVFPGFEAQIGLWEPTVRAVLAGVPPAAAARALPVTVAHRVGWSRLVPEELFLGDEEEPARSGPPVAPVGTAWGRDGLALAQARLAANVAARLTGLAAPEPPPGGGSEQPSGQPVLNPACQAHGVVVLWLAGQASPHAAKGLRQGIASTYNGTFTLTHDTYPEDPWFGERPGRFALALLDRPHDQVAQALWRNWDLVTSPETTIERLGEVLGVQPPAPGSPNRSGSGGPEC